ncbi:MAG: hypothetical protein LC808_30155 [Actinobacteria bacterium]|nr:hypothetical protein [Actinomycetota bacterium]
MAPKLLDAPPERRVGVTYPLLFCVRRRPSGRRVSEQDVRAFGSPPASTADAAIRQYPCGVQPATGSLRAVS